MLLRGVDGEGIIGLQQHGLRLHQALADGSVGGLAEVAALGVLEMRAPGQQLDVHVGQRGARQHA